MQRLVPSTRRQSPINMTYPLPAFAARLEPQFSRAADRHHVPEADAFHTVVFVPQDIAESARPRPTDVRAECFSYSAKFPRRFADPLQATLHCIVNKMAVLESRFIHDPRRVFFDADDVDKNVLKTAYRVVRRHARPQPLRSLVCGA